MIESSDVLDFRVLMCLLGANDHGVTMIDLSRTLQEKKYTITRAIDRLEKRGVVKRSDERIPYLTAEGLTMAERYHERFMVAQNHLLYEGVDLEHAKQDACCWALYCSDRMMDVLRSSDERNRVKTELKDETSISGAALCRMLKSGTYFFPFIIYREQVKENNNLSMANKGFENPCTLYVENGEGFIQLRTKVMAQNSLVNGSLLKGKVSRLEYFEKGHFVAAEIHGDVISFPASALNFINTGSGMNQVLHGSVCLRMQCSCGIAHMPQSRALFTILI